VVEKHTEALRVVFFGTPQFAVPSLEGLLRSRHRVVGVVTQPDRPRGRGQKVTEAPVKATAIAHGLPLYQPARLKDPHVAHMLTNWAADLGVVAAYGKIIPEPLLNLPRLGMINVHASLLPRYRGAAPVQRAVIDGVDQTGVTIMRMVAALDAGGMFAKVTRSIGPDETSDVVERDLANLGASLLLEVIDDLVTGAAREELQDHSLASYASKVTKEEGLVDWRLPAISIHNRVRGLYPWPHAFSYLDGERLIMMRTHVVSGSTHEPPGTVVDTSRGLLEVATGQSGRLAIDELQPEGRRPMKTREYLAGHRVQPGARFGEPEAPFGDR
jgi:methionyl-tRNA formyltransferase